MRNNIIIQKMLNYAEKIAAYCNRYDYESFCKDTMLVEACIFNLSQMGELSNKVDKSFKETNPTIEWHELYGLRNRIVHDYDGVQLTLIWEIVSENIPQLIEKLKNI